MTKFFLSSVLVMALLAPYQKAQAKTPSCPTKGGESVFAWDLRTGVPICEQRADAERPVASLSKIASYLALKEKSDSIVISREDVDIKKNSRSRLDLGTWVPKKDAMLLSLMSSENRAAAALGRADKGGMEAHVRRMNALSKNARFVEPTGLAPENVASAKAMAKIFSLALNDERARQMMGTKSLRPEWSKKEWRHSFSGIREKWKGVIAAKTGYIEEAGRCLALAYENSEGRRVGVIILGAKEKKTRNEVVKAVLRMAGEKISWTEISVSRKAESRGLKKKKIAKKRS